jgi:uncharacterized protein YndB with AHSA1/START domain
MAYGGAMPRHPVQPPEWIDAAPIRVEQTIEIAAPPAAVWERIADHERWPTWFTTLDRVEVTGAATGVGGGRTVTVKRLSLGEQFTAWDDDAHFAFAVTSSFLPILDTMAESVRLEPTETGTTVTYVQGLQAKRGCGKLLALAWRNAPRQLADALANLKRQVEAG